MHVVINHLRLRDAVADATVDAAQEAVQRVVDAGAIAARVAKVDEKHLILILDFATAEDADRVAREVCHERWSVQRRAFTVADVSDVAVQGFDVVPIRVE